MKNGTSVTRKAWLYTSTVEVDVLLAFLEDLEGSVDEADEQKGVRKAIRMIEEMSFGRVIKKYTARDATWYRPSPVVYFSRFRCSSKAVSSRWPSGSSK